MPELHLFDVVRRPVVTEKTNALHTDLNQFTFEVAMNANKHQIKQAVALAFDLEEADILQVRTMVMAPKRGRRGRKDYFRNRAWKKAIVTLSDGVNIGLFNV